MVCEFLQALPTVDVGKTYNNSQSITMPIICEGIASRIETLAAELSLQSTHMALQT
jgi:hypothetical protein